MSLEIEGKRFILRYRLKTYNNVIEDLPKYRIFSNVAVLIDSCVISVRKLVNGQLHVQIFCFKTNQCKVLYITLEVQNIGDFKNSCVCR